MASLPNRVLRLIHEQPQTMTPDAVCRYFAAYRSLYLTQTINRLQRLALVVTDDQGRMTCTHAGRAAAALPVPARWSAPRLNRSARPPADRQRAQPASNKALA